MYAQLTIVPGRVFNKLTIIGESDRAVAQSGISYRTFLCKCECGNTKVVKLTKLMGNQTKSCGCLSGEKHNLRNTKLYRVWKGMNERCHSPYVSAKHIRNYRMKGISVCAEWRKSFLTFYNWCMTNGYEHGLQIDRIDNTKGYYPANCRFVTRIINCNNRDLTVRVNYEGGLISATELLMKLNIDLKFQACISRRIKRGWNYVDAIKPPYTRKQMQESSIKYTSLKISSPCSPAKNK